MHDIKARSKDEGALLSFKDRATGRTVRHHYYVHDDDTQPGSSLKFFHRLSDRLTRKGQDGEELDVSEIISWLQELHQSTAIQGDRYVAWLDDEQQAAMQYLFHALGMCSAMLTLNYPYVMWLRNEQSPEPLRWQGYELPCPLSRLLPTMELRIDKVGSLEEISVTRFYVWRQGVIDQMKAIASLSEGDVAGLDDFARMLSSQESV